MLKTHTCTCATYNFSHTTCITLRPVQLQGRQTYPARDVITDCELLCDLLLLGGVVLRKEDERNEAFDVATETNRHAALEHAQHSTLATHETTT